MPPYVLDANIWIRVWRNHPPDIFVTLWQHLDGSIANGDIRSPEEVRHELEQGTDGLAEVLAQRLGLFVPLDEPLQQAVTQVVAQCPDLADPDGDRNRADPFVVALAQLVGGIAVTDEKPRKNATARTKIPDACQQLGIPWLDWFGFVRANGWQV